MLALALIHPQLAVLLESELVSVLVGELHQLLEGFGEHQGQPGLWGRGERVPGFWQ